LPAGRRRAILSFVLVLALDERAELRSVRELLMLASNASGVEYLEAAFGPTLFFLFHALSRRGTSPGIGPRAAGRRPYR
jgi:hypothetical protein